MNYLELKKKALHLIVGKVKGFVRSVTGVPPIALEACADNMSIIDYKIHGNSIQDGTPSPDNPIEVQSVGELVTDETDANYGKYKIPITARSESTEPIITNIYLDEPLRKVGDYADYIDFKNGMVVRKILEDALAKGSYYSIYTKLTNVIRLTYATMDRLPATQRNYLMLSTLLRYQIAGWVTDAECIFHHHENHYNYYFSLSWQRLGLTYDGTNAYRTDDETQTALTDSEIISIAKEYLLSIPEEDRKVYMILNTPTQTPISLPILPTFKGITTVYEVGTTIQPSNMEAEYYSTLKGE